MGLNGKIPEVASYFRCAYLRFLSCCSALPGSQDSGGSLGVPPAPGGNWTTARSEIMGFLNGEYFTEVVLITTFSPFTTLTASSQNAVKCEEKG